MKKIKISLGEIIIIVLAMSMLTPGLILVKQIFESDNVSYNVTGESCYLNTKLVKTVTEEELQNNAEYYNQFDYRVICTRNGNLTNCHLYNVTIDCQFEDIDFINYTYRILINGDNTEIEKLDCYGNLSCYEGLPYLGNCNKPFIHNVTNIEGLCNLEFYEKDLNKTWLDEHGECIEYCFKDDCEKRSEEGYRNGFPIDSECSEYNIGNKFKVKVNNG